MELGAFFLILALAVLVGMFISRPFFGVVSARAEKVEDHQHSALLAERDRLLTALQELDFDHQLGKIPAEDYPPQRAVLTHAAAEVLRQLDEFPGEDVPAGSASVSAPEAAEPTDETLELLIASHRRNRKEKAVGFCSKCGKPVKKSDKFCPRCGMAITL